jgi:uncharacterized membrane protein SpoIIM required for sporulation
MRSPAAADDPRAALARFEALLDRSERLRAAATGGLSLAELRELAALYRRHTARLARLRDRDTDPDAIRHLNALCVRAYGFLYAAAADESTPPRRDAAERARRAATRLAATGRHVLLACALLFGGAAIGGALVARDPDALYAFVAGSHGYGAEHVDRLWASPEARREFLERRETATGHKALFGSFLFSNNTRVGVLAWATGILAGIPTVLLLVYNGLMLGAFTAIFARGSEALHFAAWILPHGVPELAAIALCGAGGLALGEAVAAPGRRPRRAALREATAPALALFGLSLPFFLAAAAVESFVRESTLGTAPRLAVAAAFAALLAALAVGAARLARRRRVETAWLLERAEPREAQPSEVARSSR